MSSIQPDHKSLRPSDLADQFTEKVLLIVPCFNEGNRLRFDAFESELPSSVQVLFADDGSSDDTFLLLQNFCKKDSKKFFIFRSEKNVGKAAVIQLAYLFAKKNNLIGEHEWIGFWDADLATPLIEVVNLVSYRNLFAPRYLAIFASRVNRYGSVIRRTKLRHYLSRVFVTFTDIIVGVKAYDSQCGAKLFHRSTVEAALAEPFASKWVFDLEIVKRIGTDKIVEVPLQRWEDVPGSKLKLARESFRVLKDLFIIRKKYP